MWIRAALLALTILLVPSSAFADDGKWEWVGKIDGVKVWKKEVEGTDLLAFRGEVVADVHIGKIMTIFANPDSRKNWVARWRDSKTLKKEPMAEEYYIRFDTPFPVTNRDYVLRSEGIADGNKGIFVCNIKSIERSDAPENDCCVRATATKTYYHFKAMKGDQPKTLLIVEVHTDPKGMLPDWLVNLIQKKWPSDTLNGLVREAKKDSTQIHPKYSTWHDASLAGGATTQTTASAQ